jgi:hypothetical protein
MSVSDADTKMENALMSAWAAHKEWMGPSVALSFEDFKTGFYYGRVYGLDTSIEIKDRREAWEGEE